MGMLMGGSAMLRAIDPSCYVRGKCIPIVENDCRKTSLFVDNVVDNVVRRLSEVRGAATKAIKLPSYQAIAELDPPVTPSPA